MSRSWLHAIALSVACLVLAIPAEAQHRRGPGAPGAAPGPRPGHVAPAARSVAPAIARPSFSRPAIAGGGVRSFGGGAPRSFSRPMPSAPHIGRPAFSGRSFARPPMAGPGITRRTFIARGISPRSIGSRSFARPAWRGSRMVFTPRGLRAGRVVYGSRFVGRSGLRTSSARAGLRSSTGRAALRRLEARRGFAGRSVAAERRLIGRTTGSRATAALPPRGRVAASFRPNRLAAAHLARRHDWQRNWRRHRARSYGWAGPVFWPYAYDDVFVESVWGYGLYGPDEVYEDPFWSYGYADIHGGLFSPFDTSELVGWTAPGGRVASRSERSKKTAARRAGPETTGALGPGHWRQMCGEDSREVIGLPVERIRDIVVPTDSQRAALDELGTASVKAAQAVKAACPTDILLTPTGRLAAMEQRLRGMRAAIDIMRPPLEAFYASLTDEQKARLNAVGRGPGEGPSPRSFAQDCRAASVATEWPAERIERSVRPDAKQSEALGRLREATAKAAELLKTACPSETPQTPPARLAAMSARLDVMIEAVAMVRTAAVEFYGALSDEQKAQFNTIGQAKATR